MAGFRHVPAQAVSRAGVIVSLLGSVGLVVPQSAAQQSVSVTVLAAISLKDALDELSHA
jgi:ABC-type molybdate transport system substrate-binding protein